eukprot:12946119-Alexandrium_andersonii.AAC.1
MTLLISAWRTRKRAKPKTVKKSQLASGLSTSCACFLRGAPRHALSPSTRSQLGVSRASLHA